MRHTLAIVLSCLITIGATASTRAQETPATAIASTHTARRRAPSIHRASAWPSAWSSISLTVETCSE